MVNCCNVATRDAHSLLQISVTLTGFNLSRSLLVSLRFLHCPVNARNKPHVQPPGFTTRHMQRGGDPELDSNLRNVLVSFESKRKLNCSAAGCIHQSRTKWVRSICFWTWLALLRRRASIKLMGAAEDSHSSRRLKETPVFEIQRYDNAEA